MYYIEFKHVVNGHYFIVRAQSKQSVASTRKILSYPPHSSVIQTRYPHLSKIAGDLTKIKITTLGRCLEVDVYAKLKRLDVCLNLPDVGWCSVLKRNVMYNGVVQLTSPLTRDLAEDDNQVDVYYVIPEVNKSITDTIKLTTLDTWAVMVDNIIYPDYEVASETTGIPVNKLIEYAKSTQYDTITCDMDKMKKYGEEWLDTDIAHID